jgi:hypothetical protein
VHAFIDESPAHSVATATHVTGSAPQEVTSQCIAEAAMQISLPQIESLKQAKPGTCATSGQFNHEFHDLDLLCWLHTRCIQSGQTQAKP